MRATVRSLLLLTTRMGELDPEVTPGGAGRLGVYLAALRLHAASRDGEAEPRPGLPRGAPAEGLEDRPQLLRRNAGAVVAHVDDERVRSRLDVDPYLAVVGVSNGIVDEVLDGGPSE